MADPENGPENEPENEPEKGSETDADKSREKDPELHKLDELGDEIAAARRQAVDDGLLSNDDERSVDSGARPEEDDQTIAPG